MRQDFVLTMECSAFAEVSREVAVRVGKPCSNHGACVNLTCDCAAGWTGRSDIFNTEDLDCQISTVALTVLWSVTLVVTFALWLSTVSRVKQRMVQCFRARRRRQARKLAVPNALKDPAVLSIASFHIVCLPWSLTYIILKLARPEARLGSDLGVSLCFLFAHFGFFITVFCVQPFLLISLLSTSRRLKALIPVTFVISASNLIITVAAASVPLVEYSRGIHGANDRAYGAFIAYCTGNALAYFGYAAQAIFIMLRTRYLLKLGKDVHQTARFDTLRKAIIALQLQASILAMLLCIVFTMFALAPFLHNKFDYVVPVMWIFATAEWKHIAFTMAPRVQHVTVVELADENAMVPVQANTEDFDGPRPKIGIETTVVDTRDSIGQMGSDEDLRPIFDATVKSSV